MCQILFGDMKFPEADLNLSNNFPAYFWNLRKGPQNTPMELVLPSVQFSSRTKPDPADIRFAVRF